MPTNSTIKTNPIKAKYRRSRSIGKAKYRRSAPVDQNMQNKANIKIEDLAYIDKTAELPHIAIITATKSSIKIVKNKANTIMANIVNIGNIRPTSDASTHPHFHPFPIDRHNDCRYRPFYRRQRSG